MLDPSKEFCFNKCCRWVCSRLLSTIVPEIPLVIPQRTQYWVVVSTHDRVNFCQISSALMLWRCCASTARSRVCSHLCLLTAGIDPTTLWLSAGIGGDSQKMESIRAHDRGSLMWRNLRGSAFSKLDVQKWHETRVCSFLQRHLQRGQKSERDERSKTGALQTGVMREGRESDDPDNLLAVSERLLFC